MTSANFHQAALLLHAMQASDRLWLLAQLMPSQRSALAGLLEELHALGIPADPALLESAPESRQPEACPAANAAPVKETRASMQAVLSKASASSISEIMVAEPPALIAALLSLSAWPWRDAVLLELESSTRSQVEKILARHVNCAPQFGLQIMQELSQRLADCGVAASREIAPVKPVQWRAALAAGWQTLRHMLRLQRGAKALPSQRRRGH